MNLTNIINDFYNNKIFKIKINKLAKSPVIQESKKKIIDFYEQDSNITYKTNENYYFIHNKTLDKIKQYNEYIINSNKINDKEDYIILNEKLIIIKNELEKLENELMLHYLVIDELEKKNAERVKELLYNQKEILLRNYNLIIELKSKIDKKINILNNKSIINKNDDYYIDYYNKLIGIFELANYHDLIVSNLEDSYIKKIAQIEVNVQLFLQDEENRIEIFKKYYETEKEVEYLYKKDSEEILSKINEAISLFIIISKFSIVVFYDQFVEYYYENVLNIKYKYLAKHPEKRKLYPLEEDYYYSEFYNEKILNNRNRKNTEIQKIILDLLSRKTIMSSDEKYLLFFAYENPHCLKEFFKLRKEKNMIIKSCTVLLDAMGIYLNDINVLPIDTTCIIMNKYFNIPLPIYNKIYELYKAYCREYGFPKPILEGIKFTDNFQLIKELLTISPEHDVIISSDNETFSVNGKIEEACSNIILEDGIKYVELPNLKFTNKVSIEIPPSVEKLDLNIEDGNYNEIIFKDYINSKILTERWMRIVIRNYFSLLRKNIKLDWSDFDSIKERYIKIISGTIDGIKKQYIFPTIDIQYIISIIENLDGTIETETEKLLNTFKENIDNYIKMKSIK